MFVFTIKRFIQFKRKMIGLVYSGSCRVGEFQSFRMDTAGVKRGAVRFSFTVKKKSLLVLYGTSLCFIFLKRKILKQVVLFYAI